MQGIQALGSPQDLKHLLLPKLLDWPFLLFVSVVVLGVLFRRQITDVLSRNDITFAWGDKSIKLRDLSQSVDKEVDPIRDDLEALKRAVAQLGAQPETAKDAAVASAKSPVPITGDLREQTKRRLLEALNSHKYSWRSVERLSSIAAVSTSEVRDLLRSDPDVIFSLDKSGRQLAGLRSRVKPDAG